MTLNPVVQVITADEARHLTDRIKVAVEGTWQLVVEAYQSRAWVALGYSTWDDYCTREFGTSRLRLPRETRREEISSLREAGLSLRAIETATGVSKKTIIKDLRQVVESTPPEPDEEWRCETCSGVDSANHDDPEDCHCGCEIGADCRPVAPQEAARSVVAAAFARRDEPAEPAKVTGLDGKSYSKPAATPKTPNRRALPDQARDAGQELRKAIERLERLMDDDRFSRNKQEVAAHLRHHLNHAIKVCQDLNASFTD